MDCKSTGQFIAALRREKSLTQAQLAEELGVSGGAVSKWERGLCYPDIETVARLAEFFSVSTGEILAGHMIPTYSPEVVDDLTKESISEYTERTRRKVSRRAGVALALVLLLALALVPVLARHLAKEEEVSGFERSYYCFQPTYHSDTADVCQLMVQYVLNGEPCTISANFLVEKDENGIQQVNRLNDDLLETPSSFFEYQVGLAEGEENGFQLFMILNAEENGKPRRTQFAEYYDVSYEDETCLYTVNYGGKIA